MAPGGVPWVSSTGKLWVLGVVSSLGVLFSAHWEEPELHVAAEALLQGRGTGLFGGQG